VEDLYFEAKSAADKRSELLYGIREEGLSGQGIDEMEA